MGSLASYIPARQANFTAWLGNFSTLISANPAAYGLSAGDAVTIAGYNSAWSAAYAAVVSPTSKTAATVSAKNAVYASIIGPVRGYAQAIANNAGVAAADKVAVGVNPRTSKPSPITPPNVAPALTIQSVGNLSVVLRYTNPAVGPTSKSKPYGVKQVRLYGKASATPITDASSLPLLTTLTRSPAVVDLSSFAAGQQVYLAAQYATQTGGLGPMSAIVNLTVSSTVG